MTCKDCSHFDVCIKWVELEGRLMRDNDPETCESFKNKADFVEVVHGEWHPDPITAYANGHHCSACGGLVIENMKYPSRLWLYDYCPFCGAKMDGTTCQQFRQVQKGEIHND